jgi:ribonuclease E
MDPVKMKAPMPQVNAQSASHEDADESDATEHEFHEVANDEEPSADSDQVEVVKEDKKEEKKGGRRRRRAASSGVITPGE